MYQPSWSVVPLASTLPVESFSAAGTPGISRVVTLLETRPPMPLSFLNALQLVTIELSFIVTEVSVALTKNLYC